MDSTVLLDSPIDRTGNILNVILILAGIAALILIGGIIGGIAVWLTELAWPLWAAGGIGLLVLIAGYIAGSSEMMTTGWTVMGTSVGIAILGYMYYIPRLRGSGSPRRR